MRSVIKPVLKHLDNHDLWTSKYPNEFAIHSFKIIMHAIPAQHSYLVIQLLMGHLDDVSRNADMNPNTNVRTGIVKVLSNIVAISAAESIGPSVLEIINNLLNHLRASINNCQNINHKKDDEKRFQDAVMNTLAEFANNLPDFQKIEIMMFIMSKVPPTSATMESDIFLQHILLKSLLKVSTKYKTVNMSQAFPSSLLNPLLSRSLSSDPTVRVIVQSIFHQLLDRHNNLPKLNRPVSLSVPHKVTIEKAYRQDIMFMKKHGPELMQHIYESAQITNNKIENFNALYTTLALLCIELSSEDTLSELLRLTFALQDFANTKNNGISEMHRASIHGLVAGFLHLTGFLTAIPALCTYIEQVIKQRQEKAPWLLPDYNDHDVGRFRTRSPLGSRHSSPEEISEDLLFRKVDVAEALRSTGHDTTKLMTPFMPRNVGKNFN